MNPKDNSASDQSFNMKSFERNPSNIQPTELTLDSTLKFRCHPGVSCFTACCGNVNIVLTPYDILRIRRYLGNMNAQEFLLRYTTPTYLEKTDMPGVKIHLDDNNRCPFVTDEGCSIYSARPTTCRYYPVGMTYFHEGANEGSTAEEFYFLVKEPHCKGHEEDKEWTIREWRKDQGIDESDLMNREWMELVMRRKSFGHQANLSEQAKKIFFMASTDLDKFKEFVFKSSFLEIYEIEQETLEAIKNDDEALMHFAVTYLGASIFNTGALKMNESKVKAAAEEIEKKRAVKEKEAEKTYEELKKTRDDLLSQKNQKRK